MPVNKEELFALSAEEKVALAEELWGSVENELFPITDEDVVFAQERLRMHQENPTEAVSLDDFKSRFRDKYGF
jgi:putative addiction module component (TIGR02574 family)